MSHSWVLRTADLSAGTVVNDVATDGAGTWVAVATYSTNWASINTSTDDGETWTYNVTSPETGFFMRGVAYGNGYWVAVGGATSGTAARIWTATDPTGTWTERSISGWTGGSLTAAAYANSIWVAVGGGSSATKGIASTGADPTTGWTQRTGIATYAMGANMDIATDGTTFLVVGDGGEAESSTNGTSWTNRSRGGSGGVQPRFTTCYGVAYGGGRWVVTADDGQSSTNGVLWTTDITSWGSWTAVDTPGTGFPSNIEYGDGFLFRGDLNITGASDTAYWSSDGSSWADDNSTFFTSNPVFAPDYIGGAGYGNGVWVVIGDDGGGNSYIATGTSSELRVIDMTDGSTIAALGIPSATFDLRATPNGQHVFLLWTNDFIRYSRTPTLEDSLTISGFATDLADWNVDDSYNIYKMTTDGNLTRYDAAGSSVWTIDLNALYSYQWPSRAVFGSATGSGQTMLVMSSRVYVCGYIGGADWQSGGSEGVVLTMDRADGSLFNDRRFTTTGGNAGAQTIAMSFMGPCLWCAGAADGTDFEGQTISGVAGWIAKMPA